MDDQTALELTHVLLAIERSTTQLIRVVRHLQTESRRPLHVAQARLSVTSSSSGSTDACPLTPPEPRSMVLADLLDQPGGKRKRKRPITHFDGIPIDLALPPPARAPRGRPVVSPRRLRELDRAMEVLGIERSVEGDQVQSTGEDDSDEDGSDDDGSEDEDDLVIIV